MSQSDDPAEAAIRLEAALERIAAAAQARAMDLGTGDDVPDGGADAALIAARLDSLVMHLRAALGVGMD